MFCRFVRSITFLYKLKDGLASRSYGLNVARLAGLPGHVLREAHDQSRRFELRCHLPIVQGATVAADDAANTDNAGSSVEAVSNEVLEELVLVKELLELLHESGGDEQELATQVGALQQVCHAHK